MYVHFTVKIATELFTGSPETKARHFNCAWSSSAETISRSVHLSV